MVQGGRGLVVAPMTQGDGEMRTTAGVRGSRCFSTRKRPNREKFGKGAPISTGKICTSRKGNRPTALGEKRRVD